MSILELPSLLPKERDLTGTLGHSSLWLMALARRHVSSWGGEGLAGAPGPHEQAPIVGLWRLRSPLLALCEDGEYTYPALS